MAEVIKFSRSYKRMSPAVIRFAITHGAAKVDNFLCDESLGYLQSKKADIHPELLAERIPEIDAYFKMFDDDHDGLPSGTVRCHSRWVDPNLDIHTDQDIRYGLSLLIPNQYSAVFRASNDKFTIKDSPALVWEYGPRSAILLRQALEYINNDYVGLGQAYHVAHREKADLLHIVDVHTKSIVLAD